MNEKAPEETVIKEIIIIIIIKTVKTVVGAVPKIPRLLSNSTQHHIRCLGRIPQGYGQERAGDAGNAESRRRPTANAENSHIKYPAHRNIFQDIR